MSNSNLKYRDFFIPDLVREALDVPINHIQHAANQVSSPVVDNKQMMAAYIVSATIWGEARGEGVKGMQAVLNVIMNRSHKNIVNAGEIVTKPKQFSFWNNIDNKQEYAIIMVKNARSGKLKDVNSYNTALSLVDRAMKNELPDITSGANFYFNPHKVRPKWADKMIKTASIGNHDFYKLK